MGRHSKKVFSLFIIGIMTATLLAMPAETYALPRCHYEHNSFTGEDCYRPGSLEASHVDYVMGRWKCDTSLGRRGQLCGKWGRMVRNTHGGTVYKRSTKTARSGH